MGKEKAFLSNGGPTEIIGICSTMKMICLKDCSGSFSLQEKKEKQDIIFMEKKKDCKGFGMKKENWFQIMC